MTKYTDRTDENVAISLHEQGCIRDPKTDRTIMMMKHNRNGRLIAVSTFISFEDVKDAIVYQDEGFFSYADTSLAYLREDLDNDNLSHIISSLNSYNEWFF